MRNKILESAQSNEKSEQLSKALAKLPNEKHRLFVEHYCRFLSKKAAALYAGYSEKYAGRIGFEVHSRDDVRAVMKEVFNLIAVLPEDNVGGIRRLAEINIADYFTVESYFEDVKKRVTLKALIEKLKTDLEIEEEMLPHYRNAPALEQTTYLQNLSNLTRRIARLESCHKHKPNDTRIDVETVQRFRKVLNMDKVIEDNVPIKSVKYKETGIEVEFYSSADARTTMARIDGSFEADNKQRQPINYTQLSAERMKEISDKLDGSV